MKSELDAAQLFKYGKSTENRSIDDKAFCLIRVVDKETRNWIRCLCTNIELKKETPACPNARIQTHCI